MAVESGSRIPPNNKLGVHEIQQPTSARLNRVRHALGVTRSEVLSDLKVFAFSGPGLSSVAIDFYQGRSPEELEYLAFGLIANIASIKDHLKVWCSATGHAFEGDHLINTNRAVGLVHGLWNTDKHAVITRSRSGVRPRLSDIRQVMVLSSGTAPGSGALFTLDPATGQLRVESVGGGSAALVIDTRVVDEQGGPLGWLQELCNEAMTAWEAACKRAGAIK